MKTKDDINLSHVIRPSSKSPYNFRPMSAAVARPNQKQGNAKQKNDFPVLLKQNNVTDWGSLSAMSNKVHPSTTLEKEKLFEEREHLKYIINNLKKEMAILRSENLKKEHEITKKDKVIEDIVVDSQNNLFGGLSSSDSLSKAKDASLLFKVKKQFKDLKKDYANKCVELDNVKKIIKVTKFNELTIEVNTLTEELTKLKSLYKHSLSINEVNEEKSKEIEILQENIQKQHFLIVNLQESLAKSSEETKIRDEEIGRLKQLVEDKSANLKKVKKEFNYCQSAVERLNKEKRDNNEVNTLKSRYESQIADITREMNRYRDLVDKKDRQVRELESNMRKVTNAAANSKPQTFNYNDIKYIQEDPESKMDNITLLLKSKLQEKISENEKLKMKNKLLNEKLEMIEIQTGIKIRDEDITSEDEESRRDHNNNILKSRKSDEKIVNMNDGDEDYEGINSNLFDEDQFTEFTYIIIKNFEAQKLTREKATKLLKPEIVNMTKNMKDTNFNDLTKNISNKLSKILKLKNGEEQKKLEVFLNTLWTLTNKSLQIFEDKFFSLFDNVKLFTDEEYLELGKKLKKYLMQYSSFLLNSLKGVDINNTGYVTFLNFRKILESLNLKLKDRYIEFLIYVMKANDDLQESIYTLKYEAMFDLLDRAPDDSKSNTSIVDYENTEESEIVITQDDFNNKVNLFVKQLTDYLNYNKMTLRDLFKGKIYKVNEVEKSEEFRNISEEAVELQTFLVDLKQIGVELSNLDVYCIFTKYKILDDYEAISIKALEHAVHPTDNLFKSETVLKADKDIGNLDLDDDFKPNNLDQVNEDEEDYSMYSFEHDKNDEGFVSDRVEKNKINY